MNWFIQGTVTSNKLSRILKKAERKHFADILELNKNNTRNPGKFLKVLLTKIRNLKFKTHLNCLMVLLQLIK